MRKPLPGFRFHKHMLNRPDMESAGSLKTTAANSIYSIKDMLSQAVITLETEDYKQLSQLLTYSQQLAIDLGTLVETIKGEENPHTINVVKALEHFCECLWQEYQNISNGNGNTLLLTLGAFEQVAKTDLYAKDSLFGIGEYMISLFIVLM